MNWLTMLAADMTTAMTIVMAAYLIALICLIIVEVHPRGRLGRVAALASIACASLGGAAWSYAAFYERSQWPEVSLPPPSEENSGSSRRTSRRGGEIDPEADDSNGRGGSGGSGGLSVSGSGRGAGGAGGTIMLAQILGLASRPQQSSDGQIVDCDGCPPMLAVPAGSTVIGAPESDAQADAAERPQREALFWPGYLISAEPISAASFQEFLNETDRKRWSCGRPMASLDKSSALLARDQAAFATCVMPGDADAYAAWLSSRTGKAFRLPTAAEWEYAMRVLPAGETVRGRVAELVGDCWHTRLPKPGTERIASQIDSMDCDGRMLKSAGVAEAAHWHRLSARRHIGARETRAEIGFRVMRPIAGGRR